MNEPIKILGFAGSLRKLSYNRALLKSSIVLMPKEAVLDIIELDDIPVYNQDIESAMPAKIIEFKSRIKAADALLVVTPEYNYSIPGVLKNAIDWGSRPHGDNSFENKPVAIMSASTGMLGGSRAQYHLRQSFVFLNMYPVNKPEVFVTMASQKFDENGILTDAKTKEVITELLKNLVAWTKRLNYQVLPR
jgi:chromate reductase